MNNDTPITNSLKSPWKDQYGDVPAHIDYPNCTMFELIEKAINEVPNQTVLDFFGTQTCGKDLLHQIHTAAKALRSIGVGENDRVTICLPNIPQAVICVYAVNLIGAVCNMIHPLSSVGEIEFFLKDANSQVVITLDQFYSKFEEVRAHTPIQHLIITKITDALNLRMKIGYRLTQKQYPIPKSANILKWSDFIKGARHFQGEYFCKHHASDPAVILYSGGTTGTTKGILLSNMNLNALALQTAAMSNKDIRGKTMLSILPVFHGFGLGVCVHTILSAGGICILIPRFNVKSYAKLLKEKRPNFIAGVPTLFEALLRSDEMNDADLSCLMDVYSGGDSLSVELKNNFDKFLAEHHATIQIREGYGTTECVTASCLTPYHTHKEGSIGIPFPDTYYKIVTPNTNVEVPYGEEGEISISGPTVMMEYLNHPEETANTLRKHEDGHVWLHTGDLGIMDENGFIYFRQRIKRMIVSSGYSIYPSQLENIIDAHPSVVMSCVIGVPDPYRMQKVKAFVVLQKDATPTEQIKNELMEYCKKNIAKYALPYDIEIRESLPQTLVGKVAYRILEDEELRKMNIQ